MLHIGPRLPAQAYFTFTLLLSSTKHVTVKLHGQKGDSLREPREMENAPSQINLTQGVIRETDGVTDGGRTRDLQIHNLALRLLSYSHHAPHESLITAAALV